LGRREAGGGGGRFGTGSMSCGERLDLAAAVFVPDLRLPVPMCITNISTSHILIQMTDQSSIEGFLPLQPTTFHVLLSLADEDRHGYAIMAEVGTRTGGEIRLSVGTLYRSLQRMQEQGLIVETKTRPAPDEDDERRRYYRITPLGRAVARAEVARLQSLVKMARSCGVVPRTV
jgi:DNA-binding PadR family transcriptional regulator